MKTSGILLPIFSLPSDYGIGCFSKEAYKFVDFLEETGQKYWQILPLGTIGAGNSPYLSFSSFAGSAYYIDLEQLLEEGLLKKKELESIRKKTRAKLNYEKIREDHRKLLRKAYFRMDGKAKRHSSQSTHPRGALPFWFNPILRTLRLEYHLYRSKFVFSLFTYLCESVFYIYA